MKSTEQYFPVLPYYAACCKLLRILHINFLYIVQIAYITNSD